MTNFSPTFEAALEAVCNADVVEVEVVTHSGNTVRDVLPRRYNWLDLSAFMNKHDAKAISAVREI